MALDTSQFYTDPATGTSYTSYASFQQNTQGVALPNTADINTGQAISVDQLNTAAPITVPPVIPTVNPTEGTVAGATQAVKSYEQYIKEATPPETETSKAYDAKVSEVDALLPGLKGRGEAQIQAEAGAGLPEQKKALADLNAQILTKAAEATKANAEYEKLTQSLEGQTIPMSIIIGQQAQVRKMQLAEANTRSADLGLLQARALGMQGQVQAAQDSVNRAVDLKYQDRESELNVKMKQLELLNGKLTKEEKIQATALERKYQDEKEKMAEEKEKAKANLKLVIDSGIKSNFVNRNGEFFDARTGKAFATSEEFFKAAGVKSFEEAYAKGLVTDYTASLEAERDFAKSAQAKYFDVVIPPNASREQVVEIIKGSRIYQDQVRVPQGSGGSGDGTTITGTPTEKREVQRGRISGTDGANFFLKTPKAFRDLWIRQVASLEGQTFTLEDVTNNYQSYLDMLEKDKKKKSSLEP